MLLVAVACGGGVSSNEAARAIAESVSLAAAPGAPEVVDLGEVVSGDWDTFHAFPAFADPEAVEDAIGAEWDGARAPDGGPRIQNEAGILLVFLDGDDVELAIPFVRCRGDFGGDEAVTAGVPRDEARYRVTDVDEGSRGETCVRLTRVR